MYYDDEPTSEGGCLRVGLIMLVAVAALGALLYFGFNSFVSNAISRANPFDDVSISNPLAAQPTEIGIDRPAIVRQIQGLNRWETATANIDKVITAGQQGSALYNFFRGDSLILVANGDIVAGFDMAKIGENDITITPDGTSATITMPAPEILWSRLNNDKTYVYNRQTGVFTEGNPGLETEARRVAEEQIVSRACETDLLARAAAEGRDNMANLVKAFGIDNVSVNVPTGACTIPRSSDPASSAQPQ